MSIDEDAEIHPVCLSGIEIETAIDRRDDISKNFDDLSDRYNFTFVRTMQMGMAALSGAFLSRGDNYILPSVILLAGIISFEYVQRRMQHDAVKAIEQFEADRRIR